MTERASLRDVGDKLNNKIDWSQEKKLLCFAILRSFSLLMLIHHGKAYMKCLIIPIWLCFANITLPTHLIANLHDNSITYIDHACFQSIDDLIQFETLQILKAASDEPSSYQKNIFPEQKAIFWAEIIIWPSLIFKVDTK